MSSSAEENTSLVAADSHPNSHAIDTVVDYNRLIIALDFGTTYSSVSYTSIPAGVASDSILRRNIKLISSYPSIVDHGARDGMQNEVPTEAIYPLDPSFRDRDALIRSRDESEFQLAADNDEESETDSVDNNLALLRALHDEEEEPPLMDTPDEYSWGYHVHRRWEHAATHSDPNNLPLARFKLLLDDSPQTAEIRTLKKNGIITGYQDVIADYLTYLLDHVRSQLREFDNSWVREMVLCVPAIWKPRACREMQTCLAVAMRRAGFPGVNPTTNTIERLFITSESENAAEFADTDHVKSKQCFTLVDAGGGTNDVHTYRVTCEEPVRLEHEVVPPDGSLDGSSYINEDFRGWLLDKLDDETYLEATYGSINALVEIIMSEHFERRIKRNFDVFSEWPQRIEIPINGLQEDRNLGFEPDLLVVTETVLKNMFFKRLDSIWKLVESQLDQAAAKGIAVEVSSPHI
ncbi:hypothetical protein H9Q74_004346 [Fusarium xylarioides]|nr:hypothetical protein H9Q71_006790 [Fusarium xylarioides]KAG5825571.1 hypothetical protein H9Q74_004346 [Fusarium xylarioides]